MEYADYGIYQREDSGSFEEKKKITLKKTSNSEPLKIQKHQRNLMKKINGTNSMLKRIYSDIKYTVNFLEDMGELLDQRVIL